MGEGHYHLKTKFVSRSDGRAICAAAAYRSGEKIHDEHYGKTFDYTLRTSVYATEIRAPDHAPDWMKNRSQLWNGVEEFETRKNSRLAREFEISIPVELSPEQRKEAIRNFVDKELVARGMVADIAFHDFTGRHSHNPHAHILATTREIGGNGFAMKKNREWDKEETLLAWREAWAKHANRALEQAQSQTRIDHRSYKDRGIAKTPANETQQEWHQRQKQIAATKAKLDTVNQEIASLEQEQEHQQDQQLERLNAMMEIGRLLARDHIAHGEQQTEPTKDAYTVGRELAREQQSQKPQPERSETPPAQEKKPNHNRGLEPWQRDWERQHETQRKQRIASEKERERKAAIAKKEAEREKSKLQSPALSQDDRHIIEQWKQFHDRERDESRATGQADQAATPARDTYEQKMVKLQEKIAAFEARTEQPEQTQSQQNKPRHKPAPQPPKEKEPKPEKSRERGIGR